MIATAPLVSIIIPCYNNAATIAETLASATEQSYGSIEIVVVDDGSKDNSIAIIDGFFSQKKYLNYKIIQQENKGPSSARNKGVSQSTGSFLFFLDADDRIHPDAITQYEAVLKNNPAINIVYSDIEFFEAREGILILNDFKLPQFLYDNCIPIGTLVRKEVFDALGGFDENLRYLEDWELYIRIVREYGGVYKIPQTLYYYRKRCDKSSLSDTSVTSVLEEDSRLYIYSKHRSFYKEYSLDLPRIFHFVEENKRFQKKYYGIWYKKLFYSIVNKKK